MKSKLLILIILIILVPIIIAKSYSESLLQIKHLWSVEAIYINSIDQTKDFHQLGISFSDHNKIVLPRHKDFKGSFPIIYSKWEYKRNGLFDGIIKINDVKQSIFDGLYEIEILDNRKPKQILLKSNHIHLYLRRNVGFSIENPTIENF